MSLLNQKKEFKIRGNYDELYTPKEAVISILNFIPKNIKNVWECTSINSNITKILNNNNYNVIESHINNNKNFFNYTPNNYDIIITNPPYSLKTQFLRHAFYLKKPFMFLLPITTLEGIERGKMFKENKIQIIIPNKRFNFKPEKNSSTWFQTSWFCYNCNLANDLNFVEV